MKFTNSSKYQNNPILEQTFKFSIAIIQYAELLEQHKKFVIAKQVIRSGTSIGANVKEAQNAESKADFIHKMKIALKEAHETEYWLFICNELESYPNTDKLIEQLTVIIKILNKIISSSKASFTK